MTERLHFHFSLSCIGEGNGNPLQCSCLENPRDWGAWWAAVHGVAQSRTRLKRLSSSSSTGLISGVAEIRSDISDSNVHIFKLYSFMDTVSLHPSYFLYTSNYNVSNHS